MTDAQRDEAAAALRAGPVADVGGLLKPGGRHEVEEEIARLAAGGLSAHVVITPLGDALGPWHVLWLRQGYHPRTDLLLLFNGHRWEARGWGLNVPGVETALAAAEPALHAYYGRGLAVALANLSAVAHAPESRASGSALGGVALGVGAVVAAAAVGWVIVRRRRRRRESRQALADARSAAEQVFADVVLATEDMASPDAATLRDKAARLRDQIEALAPANLKQLPPRQETLTLGRLQQMENELEALRSSVLQVKRRR